MRNFIYCVAAVLVLGSAHIHAQELPSQDLPKQSFPKIEWLAQIHDPDRAGTLFVFDLDETVMKPAGYIGSDPWYKKYFQTLRARTDASVPDQAIHEIVMRIWNQVQQTIPMQLMDASALEWIEARKQAGVTVIALTARRPEIAAVTLKQLKTLGVVFSGADQKPTDGFSYHMEEGVIFASEHQSKGTILVEYLNKTRDRNFGRVIFVDNFSANLRSVHEEVSKLAVELELYDYKDYSCNRLLLKSTN